jgi:hypothetical protein
MGIGLEGCAWFDKHVEPVVKPIASCAGRSITAAEFNEAVNDLETKNYGDLAQMGIRLGWDVLACVIDNIGTQKPALKVNGSEFKRQHAVEIRSAQLLSLDEQAQIHIALPPLHSWPTDVIASSGTSMPILFSPGDCDRACGGRGTGLVVEHKTACSCWRADKHDQRKSRWVALAGGR